MAETKQMNWGMIVLVTLLAGGITGGAVYYFNEEQSQYIYQCDDIALMCFKLSKVNTAGLQTNCYYNESAPTKYKYCKSGWKQTTIKPSEEFEGKETTLEDYTDTDSSSKTVSSRAEANDYIAKKREGAKYTFSIVEKELMNSGEILVTWRMKIYKDESYTTQECLGIPPICNEVLATRELSLVNTLLSSTLGQGMDTDKEIEEDANNFFNNWQPDVKVIIS